MSDETELKVKLTAEDGITETIERVIEVLGDTKLGHAITSVSVAFEAASHVIEKVEQAFEAVKAKVEESIHAAAAHEMAEKKLSAALLVTGNYSEENVQKLDAMSIALAKSAAMSEVSVKNTAALAASLGFTGDQIEQATSAAINLAAVMNVDVNTAMRQVAMTMGGTAGRLGNIIPELKGFTESQLQAGAGVQFLADHFKDFAATLSDTYEGAVRRSDESQHQFIASLGEFITKSILVRESLAAKAALYEKLTIAVKATEEWLHQNSETIDRIVNGIKIALIVYGAYFIAINAVTIATTAATIATTALAGALAVVTSPITLTIAGVAALGLGLSYLGVTTDHVVGVIKILVGTALIPFTATLGMVVAAAGLLVSVFDKDLGASMQNAARSIANFGINLGMAGIEQVKEAEATRKSAKEHKDHADILHGATQRVDEHEQAMRRLSAEYARASENAKPALDAIKDFAPRLSLIDWQRDQKNFQDQINRMQASATIVVKTIQDQGGPKGAAEAALLQKATQDVQRASAAQTALKIKDFETTRDSALKNADVWIEYEKQKAITASQEIMLKKIAAQEDTRARLIEVKAAEFIQEQDLQRHYLSIADEAQKKAYDTDLNAYKQMLDTKLALAVDHETNKAIATDQAAQGVVGLDPVAKAQAQAQLTLDVEIAHQQRLTEALQQGLIDREQYNRESQASELAQIRATHAEEIAEAQTRGELLGMTDEGVKARQQESELLYQDNVRQIKDDSLLTDQERQAAIEDAEMTHTANMNQIREQNIQNEMQRADQMHDYWAVSLAKIRLEQERHGQILGTIRGIQNTQEFQGAQKALGDLASLRNSHSKKAFEVGKAAATAQAVINTFLAATGAYAAMAAIPFVGPALGAIAAAAAIAAGIVNIQQIQSQKFSAAHGGLDEVPASMDNSTFLLKGGEGVLQPEANKEVRAAAKTINEGGGGQNISISITIYGTPSNDQIDQMKKSIFDAIRDASERGQPIINEKGIVRAS